METKGRDTTFGCIQFLPITESIAGKERSVGRGRCDTCFSRNLYTARQKLPSLQSDVLSFYTIDARWNIPNEKEGLYHSVNHWSTSCWLVLVGERERISNVQPWTVKLENWLLKDIFSSLQTLLFHNTLHNWDVEHSNSVILHAYEWINWEAKNTFATFHFLTTRGIITPEPKMTFWKSPTTTISELFGHFRKCLPTRIKMIGKVGGNLVENKVRQAEKKSLSFSSHKRQ